MNDNDLRHDHHYLVEGMVSAECASTIRSAIERIVGVRQAFCIVRERNHRGLK
uniref:hypothetical protein n=1 Tax=Mesorhizobium atlanticum TaxID=2233532 RepID=UPI0037041EA8